MPSYANSLKAEVLQDVRYAWRGMGRNKSFSALVLLVLAVGIGVNTAVFSIVNAEIIRPLPFHDPSRLLSVWDTYLPQFSKIGVSPVELERWQKQQDLFQETAWYRYVPTEGKLSLSGSEPLAIKAGFVSTNLFSMLGGSPLAGRTFSSSEDPGSALISERLWRTHFAADPQAIGKAMRFNGQQLIIVGVLPGDRQFPAWADVWLPPGPLLGDEVTNPVRHALGFLARLEPGVSQAQAASRLLQLSRQLAATHRRTSSGWGIRVSSLQRDLTGDIRPTLLFLLSAASFLLLVGCANVASLLLARASVRSKEIAVRSALGAGTWRILRQLLTENLLLALLGGLGGLAVAQLALTLLFPSRSYLDGSVLLFVFVTSMLTGLLFGFAPAMQALRSDLQGALKSSATTSSGLKMRSALVVFEIAVTMMLVIGAGILAKSFFRLIHTDTGFTSKGVLTLRLLAPPSQRPELLFHRLQHELLSLPGVESVAASNALPLIGDRANTSRFNVPGSPLINPDALPGAQIRTVSPDYFRAMRISLQAGRPFTEKDVDRPVVIINQTMAQRFWPHLNPVGQKFISGPWSTQPDWATVVGVVADVKQFGLDSEPTFDHYYPSLTGQYLVVKTSGNPDSLKPVVQKIVRSINPELALSDVRSMDEISDGSALTRRWTLSLLITFASLALLLALVGIYGIMSWSVEQRRREIGIRMALGAGENQMQALFLRYGLKLTVAGLSCGMLASFALRRTLTSLIYGVSPNDPTIYASVSALLCAVVMAACYLPARKAAQVDPQLSLRQD